MTDPAPWQCPSCLTWIAPHVPEHRCDPPQSGVTAVPLAPGPAGSTGMSISTATLPGTVTVNVSGSAVAERVLADRITSLQLQRASMGYRTLGILPGRAA